MSDDPLLPQALEAAKSSVRNSYSKYSEFPVGAAVVTESGAVFSAPNIENRSYGLTLCAERNAIFHAVAAGHTKIRFLVLYTPTDRVHTPCGACRQVMAEFATPGAQVLCVSDNDQRRFSTDELLPHGFSL